MCRRARPRAWISIKPASFATPAGGDRGGARGRACAVAGRSVRAGAGPFLSSFLGPIEFSAPITLGSLVRGRIAYIPRYIARNDSGLPLSAPLAVGPSIILTGLYFRGDPHQCQRPELCHADPPAGNGMEFQSRGCWPYSGWVYRRDGVEAAAQGEPGPEGLLSMSESVINR